MLDDIIIMMHAACFHTNCRPSKNSTRFIKPVYNLNAYVNKIFDLYMAWDLSVWPLTYKNYAWLQKHWVFSCVHHIFLGHLNTCVAQTV